MTNEKEYENLSDFINSEEIKIRIDSNVDSYLLVFNKISKDIELDSLDDKLLKRVLNKYSFNWAGLIFGPLWGAWRGVSYWWFYVMFMSLCILLSRAHHLIDEAADQLTLVGAIVFGLYGNAWYLHKLIKNRNDSIESTKPSKFRVLLASSIIFGSSAILYVYDTYFSNPQI